MNENPEGTPNPLNNNQESTSVDEILDANPAEPMQEETIETVTATETMAAEEPAAQSEPVATETPPAQKIVEQSEAIVAEMPTGQGEEMVTTNVAMESLDPTGRVMEQPTMQTGEPKSSHKKKGLAFLIIGCVLLVAGIAAAVAAVMLTMNKPDPVSTAMQKIMSGQAPKNVAIDGNINILTNNPSSPIKRINIDLDSDIVIGSMINTSSAILTLTDGADNDYSAKFDEIYAANGDLYFKIDGATNLIEDSHILDLLSSNTGAVGQETNCITDENGETNCTSMVVDCAGGDDTDCATTVTEEVVESETTATTSEMLGMIANIIEAADGLWLRISTEELNLTDGTNMLGNSNISCITDLVSNVNKNSNSAAEMYSKYPFIKSSDKNVLVSSKQNPIYQISVDSKNFTDYINSMQNTELAESLYSCMGWENNVAVTESDVAEVVNAMPKVYAEVNNENNFTRLYLESDINDGAAHATIDLGFSYPTNVNVSEPVEYTDYAQFIQTLFTGMFNMEGVEVNTTE